MLCYERKNIFLHRKKSIFHKDIFHPLKMIYASILVLCRILYSFYPRLFTVRFHLNRQLVITLSRGTFFLQLFLCEVLLHWMISIMLCSMCYVTFWSTEPSNRRWTGFLSL